MSHFIKCFAYKWYTHWHQIGKITLPPTEVPSNLPNTHFISTYTNLLQLFEKFYIDVLAHYTHKHSTPSSLPLHHCNLINCKNM